MGNARTLPRLTFSMKHHLSHTIEPLEPRIAPAGIVTIAPDLKSATWTDVDGDLVVLKSNKTILSESAFTFLDAQPGDVGHQLALLDLHTLTGVSSGANLTFTATRNRVAHVGDGTVNVGRIDATGLDLGTVSIPGDIASFSAGDAKLNTLAVKKISVSTAGAFGLGTQSGTAANNEWIFIGATGPITIKGDLFSSIDVENGNNTVDFDVTCTLGAVTIGGNLVGGDDTQRGSDGLGAGYLFSEGPMGAVKIGGGILGGTKSYGGSVTSSSAIASVTVGESVTGGSATGTGLIFAYGPLGSVTIGGSLIGGSSPTVSGEILTVIDSAGAVGSSYNTIGLIKITGDVLPGTGTFCGAIYTTPGSTASIKAVTIGGTLYGFSTLTLTATTTQQVINGIYADSLLGPVKVGATSGTSPTNPAQIIAHGLASPSVVANALAISSVTVARSAYATTILAGYSSLGIAENPDVQIGTIKIGLNFVGSSIAAGIAYGPTGFGDPASARATPGTGFSDKANIPSKIAAITIGGTISGNPFYSATFTTGIVAQQIGKLTLGTTPIELATTSIRDVLALGSTTGFFVREIA